MLIKGDTRSLDYSSYRRSDRSKVAQPEDAEQR